MKIKNLPQKFKSFAVVETITDYNEEVGGATLVREVKYHRIPSLLEPLMEKVNRAWRFYSRKFMKNPRINELVTRLSTSGDINVSGGLKILLDMKEQMELYKKDRDLEGMVMTTRTMFALLKRVGYKRGPHKDDEYTDVNMDEQARVLMEKYGFIQPKETLPLVIELPKQDAAVTGIVCTKLFVPEGNQVNLVTGGVHQTSDTQKPSDSVST